jgi:anti-sigma regulatory factor (Ser/Thr protein kinase)
MLRVSQLIDRVEEGYGLPAGVAADLRIALDEVVTNIVNYAYRDGDEHHISIRFEIREGQLMTVVEDDGKAYDPLRAPEPDIGAPLDTRRVGGLGVTFVKGLMDCLNYERVGERNRLTLTQRIDKETGA